MLRNMGDEVRYIIANCSKLEILLCCMQASALFGGQAVEIQSSIWDRASNALAAGAATLTPAAATAAYQQVHKTQKSLSKFPSA